MLFKLYILFTVDFLYTCIIFQHVVYVIIFQCYINFSCEMCLFFQHFWLLNYSTATLYHVVYLTLTNVFRSGTRFEYGYASQINGKILTQ